MNKTRITYRFDHQRSAGTSSPPGTPVKEDKVIPLFEEEFQVVEEHTQKLDQVEDLFDTHSLNSFTTDFGNWNSKIESESERVERAIRETLLESETKRPLVESVRNQPREGPEIDPELWSNWNRRESGAGQGRSSRYIRSSKPPWIRIVVSIAGAVVTGVAFGFFVLSMFAGSGADKTVSEPVVTKQGAVQGKTEATTPVQSTAVAGQTDKTAADAASTIQGTPLQLSAKSYSFLQNGVFSTVQSAQTAQAELKKKGFASAVEQAEKVTVFTGFALNHDDAIALSQKLKEQKLEVYLKNVDIPAVTSVHWKGSKPEALGSYLTQGDKLIQMLGGLSIVHLAETKPTPLDESTLQGIRAAHQTFTTLAATVNEGADSEVKPIIQQMNTALSSSVQSMEEYKKNPSIAMLWQAQSSMMQYIIAEKKLLLEVTAQ
jgi:stage II sporulation protein B